MNNTWVPIALFGMVLGIVAVSLYYGFSVRRLQNRERMLALEKGLPAVFDPQSDPAHLVARARRTAIVLTSIGVGIILCFSVIAKIENEIDIMNGAAVGLIPLLIGIGLFVDYRLQAKELEQLRQTQP